MATTNYVAYNTTIDADWLNDIDAFYYGLFQSATTAENARDAIELGVADTPEFTGEKLSSLTPNYVIAADANKFLVSTDIPDTLAGILAAVPAQYVWFGFAVTAESEVLTTGTAKYTFRLPACTLYSVRASLKTASSSGIPTVDINDDGATILPTKLTIDENEKTSTTAATPYTFQSGGATQVIADDSEITIDVDVSGTNAVGLKVYLKLILT